MPSPTDPRKVFGFGKQPLGDYFNVPKGAAFNPAFSPAAREMIMEDDLYVRDRDALQRTLETEDKANELMDNAPFMRPRQVQKALLDDPRLYNSEAGGQINEWLKSRQEVRKPNPKSDAVLAPQFAEKITDPRRKAEFQRRMVEDGLSFEEARDQHYMDEFNEKQALQLAEAEIPEEEYAALQREGRFDPVAVARRVAQQKREQQATRYGKDPLDQEIGTLTDALRNRERVVNARGEDPATDALYLKYSERLDEVYGKKLNPPTPAVPVTTTGAIPLVPPGEVAPAPVVVDTSDQVNPVAVVSPGQQAFDEGLTPEEVEERSQPPTKEQQDVDNAWSQGVQGIAQQVQEIYPDSDELYSPAVLAARAIYTDKAIDDKETGLLKKFGALGKTTYAREVLKKIGRKPEDTAFEEPHNLRTGSQEVKNLELLKVWAEELLTRKGLLQKGNGPAAQAPPQTEKQKKAEEAIKKLQANQKPPQ